MRTAKNTVNAGVFDGTGWGGRSAAGAVAPLSFGEERTAARQCHGHGGPAGPGRIYLSAYVREPARGPCWGDMGLAGSKILRPMLAHREPQDSKNGNSKKHCKTQDILRVGGLSWGYVGPSWGYVGLSWGQRGPILGLRWPNLKAMWAHLGAMLAHLGAMLVHLGGYVALSWGYVGPSWGLCWPTLTHLEPQEPKNWKKWEQQKTP